MNQVVTQYDFTVIDYTTTQYGYLFTVGTTGSRPQEYRFIYMPYSRYPSVLMLDFYVARSISHGLNHDLIEAIRKDTEAEEGFIVFGDGSQSKTGELHEQVVGDSTKDGRGHVMELSFEAERTALIEALESIEHPMGHRPNFLKDASLDDGMTEGWRVDNDKEMKIVRNLGLTRRFVRNLGNIDPKKISFRVSEFGMIADYADSGEKDSEFGLEVKQLVDSIRHGQPDLDIVSVYESVEKVIGRSAETETLLESVMNYLRDTEVIETIKAERVSKRDLELLYQDLLGIRDNKRQGISEEAMITGARVIDSHEMISPDDMSTAYIRRFQEIKYLYIEYARPIASRVDDSARLALMRTLGRAVRESIFQGSKTGHIVDAIRDINEHMLRAEIREARRDIEESLVLHENLLGKLKDRQYPTFLHKEIQTVRDILKGQIHMHDDLGQATRVRFRYEPVLRPSDILWNPILAHRIIDSNPTVTESGIILANRDIDTLAHIERTFPWAVRDNVEKMHLIDTLTPAQRIFVESLYVERDKPEARRIYVVHGVIDKEAEQAYRDSTEYGFVFRDKSQGLRIDRFTGYVELDSSVGKRVFTEAVEILRKYQLGERDSQVEAYIEERFYTANTAPRSMLLPKVVEGADRHISFTLDTADVREGNKIRERDLWLPEEYSAEKETERTTFLHGLDSFGKNHTQKQLHLVDKPLEFRKAPKDLRIETILRSIREVGRPAVIKDELLDKLQGGGWLGNKEYPGYLDEDIIVGELLQDSPAVILEMMIDAVHNADAPSYLNEDFLVGVRERLDALIDSGILTGSKEGTKSGIVTLNLEGIKVAYNGDVDIDYSLASKETSGGIMDEEFNTATKDARGSVLPEDHFEGMKVKENLYGEIEEVIYGADYQTRPAIIQIEDPMGYIIPDGGLYPDDPDYMGDKGERGGFTSDEYAMGGKHDRGGFTSEGYAMGSRSEIGGQLHTELAMGGSSKERFGHISEEYTQGTPQLRQMYLNDEYSIGSAKSREGFTSEEYSMGTAKSRKGYTSDEYSMGTSPSRGGLISYDYSIGAAKSREGYTSDDYSIGGMRPRQGAIDIEYSLATLQLRQTFLSEDYSIGAARERDGFTNDEYTLGAFNPRQLHINGEDTIGTREAQQSYINEDTFEAAVNDRNAVVVDGTALASVESRMAFINDALYAEENARSSELGTEVISDKAPRLSFIVEDIVSSKLSKGALVHEMESNVVKLRLGQLDEDVMFAIKDTKDAVTELFLDGVKGGRISEIEDAVFGDKLPRSSFSFGDETIFAIKGVKDSYNFGDETIFAVKGGKDSVVFEDLVGIKEVKDSYIHDNLFDAIKNPKDSHLHETTESGKEKVGELEEQLVADKPQYGYLDPALPLGGTSLKYGDVPVESVGGTGLKYGDIPIEVVGGTSLKYGDVPVEIVGGTKVKYGTIEDQIVGDKTKYGNMEENIFAFKEVKDSFLHTTVFAIKGVRDSELEHTLFAGKGERDSYLEDNLFARKGGRAAYVHETLDDVVKLRNADLDEDMLFGGKGLRDSLLESELVGIQHKRADVIEELYAYKGVRDAFIDGTIEGGKGVREGNLHEGESNVVKLRNADLEDDVFFAGKGERQAHLHEIEGNVVKERYGHFEDDLYGHSLQRVSFTDEELTYGSKIPDSGFVVGEGETVGKKLVDVGFTSDEYSLATHQIRAGFTENDYSLAHKEERDSYVEKSLPVGVANARLSEIEDVDSLMATFEERCAQVITGFIFAERPEVRAEYLEQLHAFLPERTAHLMDIYHAAKTEPRDSFFLSDEYSALRDLPAEGYLPIMDTMGQGLIYDYTNDLLDQGMNPEDWEGGFGVPEDYDPNDPFNVYYPYSKDMDALELSQSDEWIEFGDGDWERDKLIGKFYSKSDVPSVSGWYRNNFLADTYKFSIDFKVDNDQDGDGAGIIFKYYDDENYWMFMVHGGDHDNSLGMRKPMQLYKVQGGKAIAVGSPMQPFKWEKDKWYTLSVSVMDDRIQIYTDSKLQYDLKGTD